MPLSNFADYLSKYDAALYYTAAKNSQTVTANRFMSSWLLGPDAGAVPSTAAALTGATTGALFTGPPITTTTNPLYLAEFFASAARADACAYLLCDRLSHQGGLSGTSLAVQTTNLPTAALTRYTDGAGVMAALEIYTQLGNSATTSTVSYTNEAGTASRTSKAVVIGATNDQAVGRFIPLPLQDGDTGVRSVESVTNASSTATAGNFGVTLFRPLAVMPAVSHTVRQRQSEYLNTFINGAGFPVVNSACLFLVAISNGTPIGLANFGAKTIEVA